MVHAYPHQENLVSRLLLSENGLRFVFESSMFTLTKSGMFVGKEYLYDRLFKLNVMIFIPKNKNIDKVFFLFIWLSLLIYDIVV